MYIGIHRRVDISPEVPRPLYYNECISIFEKLLRNGETIFLIATLSQKKIMKNEKMGIYIIIHPSRIDIVNHSYNYTIPLDDKTKEQISNAFYQEMETRGLKIEEEIETNIKKSLKSILKENHESKN